MSNSPASPPPGFSHLDAAGKAVMVDVGAKQPVRRVATAEGFIDMNAATADALRDSRVPKGDVFATALIAGIMAAKRCGDLIPLCHPLPIESVTVDFEWVTAVTPAAISHAPAASASAVRECLRVVATVAITAKTGVEMEALTAVSVAALTIYDMCKALDKTMSIEGVRVVSKTKAAANAST